MPNEWVTFELKGADELQRAFEAMPEKVMKRGLRQSLKAGALVILDEMLALAPVKTGFLREHFNIHISVRGEDLAGSAYVGPEGKMDYPDDAAGNYHTKTIRGRLRKIGRIAVASVARWHEFGTRRMPARPFMAPAWESKKNAAVDAIIEKLRDAVEDSAKK
jgi:HK97 gp10 family phage protein